MGCYTPLTIVVTKKIDFYFFNTCNININKNVSNRLYYYIKFLMLIKMNFRM